jgi:hypothetical protein
MTRFLAAAWRSHGCSMSTVMSRTTSRAGPCDPGLVFLPLEAVQLKLNGGYWSVTSRNA